MPSSYTSLLGFVQPTTGELTNQWGTVVNNQLTQLVEDAIAKTSTKDVTADNWILSTGQGVPNEARNAVLIVTGNPSATRYIIAPKQSKAYIVVNDCDSLVYLCGGPTNQTPGVFILPGQSALCAWDANSLAAVGGDFVKVAGGGGGASGGGTNQIFYQNDQTVTVSYTITDGKNAGTFGPITINSGVTVTVPTGSVWTVV
jgi:hypothetical protein